MNCRPYAARLRGILVCLALACALADLQAKPIRLRNSVSGEARANPPAGPASVAPAESIPVTGLFLIQFTHAPQAAWREQLAAMGVDLLRYVPEDAFVARLNNASPGQLRALGFVQWLGPYRPEYKIHPGLNANATAPASAPPAPAARGQPQSIMVSVLLAPRAGPVEIGRARSLMQSMRQESPLRCGTIWRGRINPAQLPTLARSDAVLWIEPAHDMKLLDEVSAKIVAGDGGPNVLDTELLGYDGSGVKVAVPDSGLNNGDAITMHPDLLGRTPAFFYYGSLADAADEHGHGTHVAGIIAGDGATGEVDENSALFGLGVAPGSSIIAQRIFDGLGNYEPPPSFEKLTRDAKRAGADIGSNSWGDDTQGRYDTSAMEFDELVRDADALAVGDQPFILEFSAGNAGPASQTIGSPAAGKNVIATGASQNNRQDLFIYDEGQEAMADFSSRGPCEDGRIKPDVVAPGTWIASLKSASATEENAWAPIDDNYFYMGGTSQAGPHVSGAAAVFVQYYRQTHTNQTPSPALVKAALVNSAADMEDSAGTAPVPNMDEGWGRVDLVELLDSPRPYEFLDQSVLLQTGQVFERHLVIAGGNESLKITLAYTDVPGFPGATKALVNDLDLELLGPDGTLYRGNQFLNGESVPGATNADDLNNVEGVFLGTPAPGEYLVRVRARNVAEDARADTGAVDQDFALVISGDIAPPGFGVVALNRESYRAPDQIKVRVVDTDLAGLASTSVRLASTTETNGENLVLLASGTTGTFTGAVATATGPATPDGHLQIAHGDTIEAQYYDASAGVTRIATARADLVPPVLSGVSATNQFAREVISWSSDEPATSIVRYGTNPVMAGLTFALTNTALTTNHSLALENLIGGRTYYYYVVSSDEAGNTTTNSNGGTPFSFVAPSPPPVLLVDEYTDSYGFGIPPLSGYEDPLNAIGVHYDVWDASALGEPALDTLRLYRAVIWRVPDFDPGWSASAQLAISNYLHGGGSLFVASMEILSRLDAAGAGSFISNVLQVQSYVTDEGDPPSTGAAEIIGSSNDPVGNGLDIVMDYSLYENLWSDWIQYGILPDPPDLSDTITPEPGASAALHNDSGDIVGLRWPGVGQKAPGRLVLMTCPFDAVPMGSGVNDRVNLLQNILSFLAPGSAGLGTVALDAPAYALPAVVTAEVGDLDQAGRGSLMVTASSSTETNGISVTLLETPTPGVFSGPFALVPATNPPAAGTLRARNGDVLRVDYFDASTNRTISALAAVDTAPPTISNVAAEPDYEQAVVSWDTSEPADSLVQYGESRLLNRTIYSAASVVNHGVTLPGLTPDRTYYYQVVSRDPAGNAVVDDNHGQLYTVHTLLPLTPPWADNMDSGATNWTAFSSDGSEVQWTLGVPNNSQEHSAHSPPDAWGSNLNGDPIDYTESFLISPALYLTGGNVATLRFWHSYDFTEGSELDIVNYGTVYLLTNNAATPAPLATFSGDATPGWEEVELDLTPYLGRVVYLAWNHELLSFDIRERPGWLVDDVSITVSNIQPGTIQISNNLWQTTFVLNGPLSRNGNGIFTRITNAPPGEYVIEFGDVPFYETPAAQTNTLVSGATVTFAGAYTFADTNHNGLSDDFERQYALTNATAQTDADGDGMSDYAEFIAGTNPTNSASALRLTATLLPQVNVLQLKWNSVPGHAYRVLSSADWGPWTPVTDWLRATTPTTTFNAPPPGNYITFFYRVEVRP